MPEAAVCRSRYSQRKSSHNTASGTRHHAYAGAACKKSNNLAQYELQVEELVDKELEVFKAMYLQETKIKYLIIIGDYISEISRKVEKTRKTIP